MAYEGILMFMEKLNQLINSNDIPSINNPEIIRQRPQFQLLYDELGSLIQTFFIDQHQDLEQLIDLKQRFIHAAAEAKYIIDLFLSDVQVTNNTEDFPTSEDLNPSLNLDDGRRSFKSVVDLFLCCFHIRDNEHFPTSEDLKHSLNLDDVRRSLKSVKEEFMQMDSTRRTETTLNQSVAGQSSISRNSPGSKKLMDEFFVGIDRDVELIRDKLVEDQKKLHVVSIVGMGGIGKTTLATKVFNDGFVKYHFYDRVWVTVSETYDKRAVLTQILQSIRGQPDLENNNDSQLRELVHKNLMDKRYLIVIDDIWHIETWNNLRVFFPNDNNGSRILLTSRHTEVAKHACLGGFIHHLESLNKETSWELLCQKVFHGNECPEWSIKPGMKIVESCQGLPLAVVVIAGVLEKEAWSKTFWEEISYKMGSYLVGDENGCIKTLGLSYNHLPLHLRECFLYFGGFPEDYTIRVRELIWLWVAEGLIQQDGNRRLEDIAEGYLMDLIDRNLVTVAHKSKLNGGVKACKVHDLVRELCLKKAKEERFILKIERLTGSSELYRVLKSYDCPKGMELLVHLRYLEIQISDEAGFPDSICKLWNLQTLIIHLSRKWHIMVLPSNISDLVNLRHLRTDGTFVLPSIERPMKNLQTISEAELGYGVVDNLQKCFPYIKKLKCITNSDKKNDFQSLIYLENLNLSSNRIRRVGSITFPATLKSLTLKMCLLQWSDMSKIQSLPNLQVLKIDDDAFKGRCWNTDGQEFPHLQFLTLEDLDIEEWEAYSRSFPCLKQLQIICCPYLKEIPLEIGDIPMLELIQIKWCRRSVGESVRRIEEDQHDNFGNYHLKIDIQHEELY